MTLGCKARLECGHGLRILRLPARVEMNVPLGRAAPSPVIFGLSVAALAEVCVAVGATSLIDAADGWQDVLATLRTWRRLPGPHCAGQYSVQGWGNKTVLVLAGIAVLLLAVAAVGSVRLGRWGSWGQAAALVAILPIGLMGLDTFWVYGSPIGDCDAVGLRGAAANADYRAGWLFFAAAVLCGITSAWLWSQTSEASFPSGGQLR